MLFFIELNDVPGTILEPESQATLSSAIDREVLFCYQVLLARHRTTFASSASSVNEEIITDAIRLKGVRPIVNLNTIFRIQFVYLHRKLYQVSEIITFDSILSNHRKCRFDWLKAFETFNKDSDVELFNRWFTLWS